MSGTLGHELTRPLLSRLLPNVSIVSTLQEDNQFPAERPLREQLMATCDSSSVPLTHTLAPFNVTNARKISTRLSNIKLCQQRLRGNISLSARHNDTSTHHHKTSAICTATFYSETPPSSSDRLRPDQRPSEPNIPGVVRQKPPTTRRPVPTSHRWRIVAAAQRHLPFHGNAVRSLP